MIKIIFNKPDDIPPKPDTSESSIQTLGDERPGSTIKK